MKAFKAGDRCPKCGCPFIDVRFCEGGYPCHPARVHVKGEHLHLTCQDCTYEWVELPIEEGVPGATLHD